MPGMTGLEAAQALAEDWPDGVPFPLLVFVTATIVKESGEFLVYEDERAATNSVSGGR